MKTYDGNDIKCLLGKRGYSLSDVGRELGVTPQAVWNVAWGLSVSQMIATYIERLLGWKPGRLKIARASNRRAA